MAPPHLVVRVADTVVTAQSTSCLVWGVVVVAAAGMVGQAGPDQQAGEVALCLTLGVEHSQLPMSE